MIKTASVTSSLIIRLARQAGRGLFFLIPLFFLLAVQLFPASRDGIGIEVLLTEETCSFTPAADERSSILPEDPGLWSENGNPGNIFLLRGHSRRTARGNTFTGSCLLCPTSYSFTAFKLPETHQSFDAVFPVLQNKYDPFVRAGPARSFFSRLSCI